MSSILVRYAVPGPVLTEQAVDSTLMVPVKMQGQVKGRVAVGRWIVVPDEAMK